MITGEIIGLKNVTLDSISGVLLEGANFSFNDQSRVAIVGSNGAGKSTLLQAMAGLVDATAGQVVRQKHALVEYVPQFVPQQLLHLRVGDALTRHITERRPLVEEWRAYEMLSRFRLPDDVFDRRMDALSGGEANRVLLARAMVVEPDFVLLDEPTNHLDVEETIRFERLIKEELSVPFCIVSHDRELLDRCTSQTLFLRGKKLYFFGHSYSEAKQALAAHDEDLRQKAAWEVREIGRLHASADKMENWVKKNSKFATRYQNLRRRASVLEENSIEVHKEKKKVISLATAELQVKTSLRIEKYEVAPLGDSVTNLFSVRNFSVTTGDRIAVMGGNGSGKTTFLKALLHAYAYPSASIKFNRQVRVGYFDQELANLPLEKSPFSYLARHVATLARQTDAALRNALIVAGIPYGRHEEPLAMFSGGERARIVLLGLKLAEPNFLILDEPTNHVDVEGIEDLETQLLETGASIVMVSHDRRFVERVAQRFFVIRDQQLQEVGTINAYYDIVCLESPLNDALNQNVGMTDIPNDNEIDSVLRRIIELEDKQRAQAGAPFASNAVGDIKQLYRKLKLLEGR